MTEGNGEVRELSKGWCWSKLGEICQEVETKKPELEPNLEFQYIDIASIDNVIKKIVAPKKYLGKDAPSRARQVVKTDDIVFSTVRTYLMNIALVPESLTNQIASTGFCVIRGIEEVSQKYIFYYAIFYQFINSLNEIQRGTSYPAVRDKDIFDQLLPLCSTTEQNRIVEKIEELFSDLDQGIENLKKAQKQLKVYRQVMLKWAFEGKLTEKWRASQIQQEKLDIQTGEELLVQIKVERENRYQQQLEDWKEAVREWEVIEKVGKKPTKPQKLKYLPAISEAELVELPQLPDGWCWVRIGNISRTGTGVTPFKKNHEYYENGNIPWVTSGALNEMYVREASDFVTSLALEETNLKVYPKHTLLVALYGEGKTRGKCSELLIDATTNQAIAAIVQEGIEEQVRPYLKGFLQKNYDEIRLKSSGGVQPNLNLSIIENIIFPICSLNEQDQIVQEIESRLSICDRLEDTIIENLQKAEALRQSILKQAFEGKLVPQDPNDEPAEKLLERIRQEKIKVKQGEQLSIQGL